MSRKALAHLNTDKNLAALIERVGPIKLKPRRLDPFESLTGSVIYQQLSGKAAATILGRFKAHYGENGFPSPAAVLETPHETLRSVGLSNAKAKYIVDIAGRAATGLVPTLEQCDELTDDELIKTLTEIKGVGRWTVEMLLIFNLGRPDVLPIHDLGVQKGFQLTYRKRSHPKPEVVAKYGARWAPYRSLASLYLWRATDLLKVKKL